MHNTGCGLLKHEEVGQPDAKGGVYALAGKHGVHYVGRSKNLARRQADHGRKYGDSLEFRVTYRTNRKTEQRGLEQQAMDHYRPVMNKRRGVAKLNPFRKRYIRDARDFRRRYGIGG